MIATVHDKYPDMPHGGYKVVRWKCPTCNAPIEMPHDPQFQGPIQLEWQGQQDCSSCEEVYRTHPTIYDFIKRIATNRPKGDT